MCLPSQKPKKSSKAASRRMGFAVKIPVLTPGLGKVVMFAGWFVRLHRLAISRGLCTLLMGMVANCQPHQTSVPKQEEQSWVRRSGHHLVGLLLAAGCSKKARRQQTTPLETSTKQTGTHHYIEQEVGC